MPENREIAEIDQQEAEERENKSRIKIRKEIEIASRNEPTERTECLLIWTVHKRDEKLNAINWRKTKAK